MKNEKKSNRIASKPCIDNAALKYSLGGFSALLLVTMPLMVFSAEQKPTIANKENLVPDYRLSTIQTNISPYHALADDGWTVVSGAPEQSIRVDYGTFEGGPMVGIWKCTTGIIEMASMPYNEFFTVYEGEIIATLNNNKPTTLHPGDSFYVPKGAHIRLEIRKDVGKHILITGDSPVVN